MRKIAVFLYAMAFFGCSEKENLKRDLKLISIENYIEGSLLNTTIFSYTNGILKSKRTINPSGQEISQFYYIYGDKYVRKYRSWQDTTGIDYEIHWEFDHQRNLTRMVYKQCCSPDSVYQGQIMYDYSYEKNSIIQTLAHRKDEVKTVFVISDDRNLLSEELIISSGYGWRFEHFYESVENPEYGLIGINLPNESRLLPEHTDYYLEGELSTSFDYSFEINENGLVVELIRNETLIKRFKYDQ